MERLLLVDLSSVFYPAWHAAADKPVSFAYEVALERVRRAARGFARVVVACDAGDSFRKAIDPAYKAGRPDRDPGLVEQMRRVQETLDADGCAVIRAPGFEADDVIATFAAWARPEPGSDGAGYEVEVLSGDKDLLALVGDGVRVRSVSTDRLMGPEEVLAKFGVAPAQIADWLALVGDASDNIRGVPGVGPKHAARLLGQFGSLDRLIASAGRRDESGPLVHPPSIDRALVAVVADGSLARARQLVALRTDVPIDCADALEPRAPRPVRPDFGADLDEEGETAMSDAPSAADQPAVLPAPPVQEPSAPAPAPAPAMPGPSAIVLANDDALAPAESRWALEPRSMRQAVWVAGRLFESRLFSAYGTPEAVLAVVLAGREMGLGALTALRGMHIIKGKVAMSSQLMIGLVLSSGRCDYYDLAETTATSASYATRRRGSAREVSMSFTLEQARQMGLLEPSRSGEPTQWQKDPENMLRHRCAARLARVVYPDVVSNCYLPEELEE